MEPTLFVQDLVQPILSTEPEPRHDSRDMLPLSKFLDLLREEEDYFKGDQQNTKLMITRLRKIFYDKWGWNTQLIKGAWNIDGRYEVDVKPASENLQLAAEGKKLRRFKDCHDQGKVRTVVYKKDDRVHPERQGQTPDIYKSNHQEVQLPDGYCCDIAHVLAGLDAFNHPQVVSPLPPVFSFLYRLFPHVESNAAVVTWLGDIATSAGSFVLDFVCNNDTPLDVEREQEFINDGAPGSDMLGNIDAYIINKYYDVSARNGWRVTDILNAYYNDDGAAKTFRDHRFSTFCRLLGLEGWDGRRFSNEAHWVEYFEKQLCHNVCFQVYSLSEEGINSIWLPLRIWRGRYDAVIKCRQLLSIFLKALKEHIQQEP